MDNSDTVEKKWPMMYYLIGCLGMIPYNAFEIWVITIAIINLLKFSKHDYCDILMQLKILIWWQ